MSEYKRPLPLITELSKRFYDGCREGKLQYQQCKECKEVVFFPKAHCSNCMSSDLDWKTSSGRGKIYSFTVTYDAAPPEFMPYVPFVLAIVNMDEGFSILSNIEECDFEDLQCDMPVVVKFDPITPEVTLPKFIPANEDKRKKINVSR